MEHISKLLTKIKLITIHENTLRKEKEKLSVTARAETRRIINERTAEAEELLKNAYKRFE